MKTGQSLFRFHRSNGMSEKSVVCCVIFCLVLLIKQNTAQECNLAQIFRTPKDMSKINMDHFELLERSNFQQQTDQPPTASTPDFIPSTTPPSAPKTFANAQIMVRFGGDNIEGANHIQLPPCTRFTNARGGHNHNLFYPGTANLPLNAHGQNLCPMISHSQIFSHPQMIYSHPQPCYHPYPPPVPYAFPNYYYCNGGSPYLPPQLEGYFGGMRNHPYGQGSFRRPVGNVMPREYYGSQNLQKNEESNAYLPCREQHITPLKNHHHPQILKPVNLSEDDPITSNEYPAPVEEETNENALANGKGKMTVIIKDPVEIRNDIIPTEDTKPQPTSSENISKTPEDLKTEPSLPKTNIKYVEVNLSKIKKAKCENNTSTSNSTAELLDKATVPYKCKKCKGKASMLVSYPVTNTEGVSNPKTQPSIKNKDQSSNNSEPSSINEEEFSSSIETGTNTNVKSPSITESTTNPKDQTSTSSEESIEISSCPHCTRREVEFGKRFANDVDTLNSLNTDKIIDDCRCKHCTCKNCQCGKKRNRDTPIGQRFPNDMDAFTEFKSVPVNDNSIWTILLPYLLKEVICESVRSQEPPFVVEPSLVIECFKSQVPSQRSLVQYQRPEQVSYGSGYQNPQNDFYTNGYGSSSGYSTCSGYSSASAYSQVGDAAPQVSYRGYSQGSGGGYYSDPTRSVYYRDPTNISIVSGTGSYGKGYSVPRYANVVQKDSSTPHYYKVLPKYDIVPKYNIVPRYDIIPRPDVRPVQMVRIMPIVKYFYQGGPNKNADALGKSTSVKQPSVSYCQNCGYPLYNYGNIGNGYCSTCARETKQLNDY